MNQSQDQCYLPDFCTVSVVLMLVLLAELMAIVSCLVSGAGWVGLALHSLFMLWVVLSSAAVLCALRPLLARLPVLPVALVALGVVLAVTLATSVLGQLLLPLAPVAGFDGWRTLRQLAVAGILAGIGLRFAYLQQALREQRGAELQSRIAALQARIRPHFLFNSMNTIASLIASDPELAERVVEDLSDLFRQSLASDHPKVSVAEELALCRRFARIESLRLGHRLRVEWSVAALPECALIPRFTLQPLLENAIYHGIQPLPAGGVVRVSACREGDVYTLEVVNPVAPAPVASQGHGMALDNIGSRLQALYGAAAGLDIHREPGWFAVRVRLPYEMPGAAR